MLQCTFVGTDLGTAQRGAVNAETWAAFNVGPNTICGTTYKEFGANALLLTYLIGEVNIVAHLSRLFTYLRSLRERWQCILTPSTRRTKISYLAVLVGESTSTLGPTAVECTRQMMGKI